MVQHRRPRAAEGEGELFIVGRTKEMIIRSGFNVYPAEVEAVLNAHDLVVQSAVVGRKVEGNEEVVAFVQLMPGAQITRPTCCRTPARQLTSYKRPSEIVVLEALPAASTGKILKHKLWESGSARQLLRDRRRLTPSSRRIPQAAMENTLAKRNETAADHRRGRLYRLRDREEIRGRRLHHLRRPAERGQARAAGPGDRSAGGKIFARSLDARKEDEIVSFLSDADAHAPLEVCIFNIGANVNFPILDTTERVFRKVWEMACYSGFLAGREAARLMLPRGRGNIFFTGATASLRGGTRLRGLRQREIRFAGGGRGGGARTRAAEHPCRPSRHRFRGRHPVGAPAPDQGARAGRLERSGRADAAGFGGGIVLAALPAAAQRLDVRTGNPPVQGKVVNTTKRALWSNREGRRDVGTKSCGYCGDGGIAAGPAHAETVGVTESQIKIGATFPFSGPASPLSNTGKGMIAYVNSVNERGGINGRKINLITYDDAYSAPKTVEQTRKLIESDEVALLFGPLGTPGISATIKYVNAKKVPHCSW